VARSSSGGSRSRTAKQPKRSAKRSRPTPKSVAPAEPAEAPGHDAEHAASSTPRPAFQFPVIAIGASAGGLEAIRAVLSELPPDPGAAILIAQHLARDRDSLLPDILASDSRLRVVEARAGAAVEPDRAYVMPPNAQMILSDGHLRLEPRPPGLAPPMPVDFLFRSLAQHAGEAAIAVVLSGTGSDGAQGIREIKAAGGITIVQEPASARYDGMPRAALATEAVDLVLSPSEIAREVAHLARHFRVAVGDEREPTLEMRGEDIDRIFLVLRNETGVDFTNYKRPTIRRRLQRRMVVNKVTRLADYVDLLSRQPSEVRSLYQDLLIHVTRFFREPESFEAMAQDVFPALLEQRPREAPIRVWVPGCSTGEEAYSIAIALLEFLAARASTTPVQVFATDLAENAIERARSGLYPENIASDVSPERLRRFFTRTEDGYRIRQAVRDVCVFARQDVTRDPPFSKLDLILCRNLLIYLGPMLQQRLLQVFYHALKPRGFLVLGHVESVGAQTSFFELVDKRCKIFAKKITADAPSPDLSFHTPTVLPGARVPETTPSSIAALLRSADAVLLERYAPVSVVVDEAFQIVHSRGRTGPYLELPSGAASLSLPKMAREGIAQGLRLALRSARETQRATRREILRAHRNGSTHGVAVEVVPLRQSDGRTYYLVLFEEKERPRAESADARDRRPPSRRRGRAGDARAAELESELQTTRDHLQAMIHDLEAANEELQSANEEILSSNEELQSTNEELDTAREELQSTNEEINTVNEELHGRNEELVRANSDLVNLLGSVQIAIVIVSRDLHIRRFTPIAERVLNLIATDVGRPIGHIKPNIDCPDLERLIGEVIERVAPYEREVQDHQGNWYSLRIRPYKNLENHIDGAVLALVDVSMPKRHAAQVRDGRMCQSALLELLDEPVALLDRALHVRAVSRGWQRAFGRSGQEPLDRPFFELAGGRFDVPELRALLDATLASTSADGERSVKASAAGGAALLVTALRLGTTDSEAPAILLQVHQPMPETGTP